MNEFIYGTSALKTQYFSQNLQFNAFVNYSARISAIQNSFLAYCPRHKKWEFCNYDRFGHLLSSSGCFNFTQVPVAENIAIYRAEFSVNTQKFQLNMRLRFCSNTFNALQHKLGAINVTFNFLTGHYNLSGASIFESQEIVLPKEIMVYSQSILSNFSYSFFGFPMQNKILSTNLSSLCKYTECPANPSLASLNEFFKNHILASLISRKDLDPFATICKKINLPVYKTLRSDFEKNPDILPLYTLMTRLGFKDINLIKNFYTETTVHLAHFNRIHMNFNNGTLSFVDSSSRYRDSHTIKSLNTFITDCIQSGISEKTVYSRFIKALKQTPSDYFFDGLQIYYSNRNNLSESLLKKIQKNCFTVKIHDELLRYFPQNTGSNLNSYREIEYSAEIQDWEEKDGNLQFLLPHNTNELSNFGNAMHNCVGWCYKNNAVNGHCVIAVMVQNGTYEACMEIIDNTIVQLRGQCNTRLDKEKIDKVQKWAIRHRITFAKDINSSLMPH